MKTKIKVSEATDLQLDWLVAKCLGIKVFDFTDRYKASGSDYVLYATSIEKRGTSELFSPTADDFLCNRIMFAERICLNAYIDASEGWNAHMFVDRCRSFVTVSMYPRIAVLRCYVASKLGEEVEVPDESC